MLHRIGAILAVLAALWALLAAGTSLYLSAGVGPHDDPTAQTVAGLGWLEVALAALAVVLGALTFFVRRRWPGLALIAVGLLGAVLSSSVNLAFMLTVAVGGFIAFMGRRHARRHGGSELP